MQSACGQRALEQQLKEEGVGINLQSDETTQWFNTLWADNGTFEHACLSSLALPLTHMLV